MSHYKLTPISKSKGECQEKDSKEYPTPTVKLGELMYLKEITDRCIDRIKYAELSYSDAEEYFDLMQGSVDRLKEKTYATTKRTNPQRPYQNISDDRAGQS